MAGRRSLYVETMIRSDLDTVWRLTQDPSLHARWDARFGRIEYLPRSAGEPQRFRYATAVLPGLWVHGVGTSVGERRRADGSGTSALCFGSQHPLSPILEGSGYWRYTAEDGGVRFMTGYDYRPRWGRAGVIVDAVFRPVMGWATAWSFDRLRLWAERGLEPERSRRRAVFEVGVRAGAVLGAVAVAARTGRRGVLAGVAVAAVAVPPMPGTPAARRCRRRPPDRLSATPPASMASLAADRSPRFGHRIAASDRSPRFDHGIAASDRSPRLDFDIAAPRLDLGIAASDGLGAVSQRSRGAVAVQGVRGVRRR